MAVCICFYLLKVVTFSLIIQVTVVGFGFILISYLLQAYYTPLLTGHAPRYFD